MTDRTDEILLALETGDWSALRERTDRELDRIRGLYTRGMLTRREAVNRITDLAYGWNRGPVFRALDLRLPLPEADWAALRETWLARVMGEGRREAESPAVKQRLLDLLEALALPVFLLEPVPGWIDAPRWLPVYTGGVAAPTAERAICLHWTEDGGLFRASDPLGKTYTLHSAEGVTVQITVTHREEGREAPPAWRGTGFVSHFTEMEGRQDPTLRLSWDGALRWQEDERDRARYEADPRWQPYLTWCRQAEDKRALWLSSLLDR